MGAIDCVGYETRRIILDVLRAMAWADGRLVDDERRAARGAAIAFGLVVPEAPDGLESGALPLHEVGFDALSGAERRIVYACGVWMALADDVQTRTESLLLRRLRDRLGLPADVADRIEDVAYAARTRHADHERPWRELDRLVVSVSRRAAIHAVAA